jgi:CheY-like chemotaxis protein
MHPAPVLYVEDEDNDVFLMHRAFQKAGVANPLHVARDGSEAMRYLSGQGDFADRERFPLPCLLLLDLNLPRRSGLEVLKWTRDQPALRAIPIVILTSSSQDRDIASAYSLGANGYLVKPPSPDKLLELVTALRDSCLRMTGHTGGLLELKGSLRPSGPLESSR